jgi:hypothetical protein
MGCSVEGVGSVRWIFPALEFIFLFILKVLFGERNSKRVGV